MSVKSVYGGIEVIRKILIATGITMASLFLFMIILVLGVSSTNKPKASNEEILQSSKQNSNKAIVVYQPSISDISSRMAHKIAQGLHEGGYEVTLNYPGEHLPTDISKYSIIVFGSGVYAGQPSKALTDYMSKIKDYSNTRIILYSTGSSMNESIELDKMESYLNGTKAYKKIKFYTNAKKENDKIAYDLGKELTKK